MNPQSPLAREDCGVVIDWWIGWGRVAVSESKTAFEDRSPIGRGKGGGIENTLDARKRAPPGETLRDAIVALGRSIRLGSPAIGGLGASRSTCGYPLNTLCFYPREVVSNLNVSLPQSETFLGGLSAV